MRLHYCSAWKSRFRYTEYRILHITVYGVCRSHVPEIGPDGALEDSDLGLDGNQPEVTQAGPAIKDVALNSTRVDLRSKGQQVED